MEKMERSTFQLTASQMAWLREQAAARTVAAGKLVSISEIVREAVDGLIVEEKKEAEQRTEQQKK